MVIMMFVGNKNLIRDEDIFWFENSLLMMRLIGYNLFEFLKGF